jgi:D-alanyl-lipoteichoic acid acyltransferase DltB (MBOAT superfamily)
MIFASDLFLFVFLPATYLLFLAATRGGPRLACALLGFASCVFYAAWRVEFLPLLLGSVAFNWLCGHAIAALARARRRAGLALGFGVATNLLLLGWFKYAGFLAVNLGLGAPGVLLPIGISFYTFTQIAYLADVREEPAKVERDPLRYLLFVTFFPHLVAGPVLHHRDMLPQFAFPPGRRLEDAVVGVALFTLGLFKKVMLADGVQPFVGLAFGPGAAPDMAAAWLGVLAFALQLYFDFSGYSDMALGLARLFGVRFPLNFDSPYKAASIIDFWRRWHMSLSRFLRDYLYIPLGGSRRGLGHMPNLMITMLLGGLWHGAGWTFLLWGALHGAFLMANHAWRRLAQGRVAVPHAAGVALSFLCVVLAWVPFRADDLPAALGVWQAMAGFGAAETPAFCEGADRLRACRLGVPLAVWWIGGLLVLVWAMPNTQQLLARYAPALEPVRAEGPLARRLAFRPSLGWALLLAVLLAASVVWLGADSPFLYYQF